MNEQTRGKIESILDKAMKRLDLDTESSLTWILQEQQISSPEDLTLGYILGYLARIAHETIAKDKIWKNIDQQYEKVTGKKLAGAKGKKSEVKLTPKDMTQAPEMLKRRIPNVMETSIKESNR